MQKIIESYLDSVVNNFKSLNNNVADIEAAAKITIDALKNMGCYCRRGICS